MSPTRTSALRCRRSGRSACNRDAYCGSDDVCVARPALACDPAPLAYETFADAYGGTFSSPAVESGSCGGSGPEAVYSFTAPVSGTYGLSTAGSASGYDTVLYVRDGSCDGPELACNDDYDGSVVWSALLLDLVAGQDEPGDYSLVVGLE